MWFWIFLFISNMLVPVIMIGFGWLLKNHPPKEINAIYGYRTKRSMKNKEMWEFANRYCGRLWLKIGAVMAVPTAIASALAYPLDEDGQGWVSMAVITVQCVALIGSIFPVERALKDEFGEE